MADASATTATADRAVVAVTADMAAVGLADVTAVSDVRVRYCGYVGMRITTTWRASHPSATADRLDKADTAAASAINVVYGRLTLSRAVSATADVAAAQRTAAMADIR